MQQLHISMDGSILARILAYIDMPLQYLVFHFSKFLHCARSHCRHDVEQQLLSPETEVHIFRKVCHEEFAHFPMQAAEASRNLT